MGGEAGKHGQERKVKIVAVWILLEAVVSGETNGHGIVTDVTKPNDIRPTKGRIADFSIGRPKICVDMMTSAGSRKATSKKVNGMNSSFTFHLTCRV